MHIAVLVDDFQAALRNWARLGQMSQLDRTRACIQKVDSDSSALLAIEGEYVDHNRQTAI
jgi:hypothetical protein